METSLLHTWGLMNLAKQEWGLMRQGILKFYATTQKLKQERRMTMNDNFFSDNPTNSYAKVGIYGAAGAGKTYTATLIAIGIYKKYKLDKPIVFFDTETGYSWVKPKFEKEGISSGCKMSRTFVDLMAAVDYAEKNCSVLIVDSITHVWQDLCKSFLDKHNEYRVAKGKAPLAQLDIQQWGIVKEEWKKFTLRFLTSNLHMIICGRAGDQYVNERNENGKIEFVKVGSKMVTEKELAYEPSLLIEMLRDVDRESGAYRNACIVEKDRSDSYQGARMLYPKFSSFSKHFDFIAGAGNSTTFSGDSKEIFNDSARDGSNFMTERKNRTIFAEEIKELIAKHFPGRDAKAISDKANLLEKFFNTRSWTLISEETDSDILKDKLRELRQHLEPVEDNFDVDVQM